MQRARVLLTGAAMGLAAALAGVGVTAVSTTPKTTTQAPARRYDTRRSLFGGSLGWAGYGRRARRGWSNAQVKRMAVKRRNKARHRRACR